MAPVGHRSMAFAVERSVRRHLRQNYAGRRNALGATSTGFWKRVIESTAVAADGEGGTVAITERGAALRYFGGVVRPGPGKKWLTIPAAREAHGKRAAEVSGGYAGQQWLFNRQGRPFAIAEKVKVNKRGRQTHGRVLFWLTKEAEHAADSGVLPQETEMVEAAGQAALEHIARKGAL